MSEDVDVRFVFVLLALELVGMMLLVMVVGWCAAAAAAVVVVVGGLKLIELPGVCDGDGDRGGSGEREQDR